MEPSPWRGLAWGMVIQAVDRPDVVAIQGGVPLDVVVTRAVDRPDALVTSLTSATKRWFARPPPRSKTVRQPLRHLNGGLPALHRGQRPSASPLSTAVAMTVRQPPPPRS